MENSNLKVDYIIDTFDFEKVHKYMVETNWKWLERVPSIEEIKKVATSLVQDVINSKEDNTCSSTGGFRATKFKFEHSEYYSIHLCFQIEWKQLY